MRLRIGALLAMTALLGPAACGGGSGEPESVPDEGTTGGEAEEGEEPTPDPMEDPCAQSEGEPCTGAEGEGESEGEENGEGDGESEGEGEGEGEGEAEGEGEGETQDLDPRTAWRQMVGRGRAVFLRTCDTCHPDGEEDIGPDIRRSRLPVERMLHQIRNGRGRMRAIPPRRLPDRYIDDLMAFLSTLGTVRGVERPQ